MLVTPQTLPRRKNRWMFKRGELKRAVLAAIRGASGPLSNADIAEQVIIGKDWAITPTLIDTVADKIKDVRKRLPPSVEPQIMLPRPSANNPSNSD